MRRAHGGAAAAGRSVLDFSVSLNPLGPPDSLGMLLSAEHLAAYPEPHSVTLQRAIAQRHGVDPDTVLVTNGACEAIELVMASLRPKRVVVLVPAFTEYEDAARAWGHQVTTVAAREEDGFAWDFSRLDLHPDDLVVLGNPANPTGVLTPLPSLDATLLIDETFLDFVDNPQTAVGRPRTLVVRSFTKIFACPGLRLGYIVGDVGQLRERQPTWSVGRLAQVVGEALLKETAYLEFTRRFVRECRDDLTRGLRSVDGVTVFPSAANYVFFRVPQAGDLARRLNREGVVVRQCDSFTGLAPDCYLRVAVRKRSENQRLLEALHVAR
ncbi:MAG TPA: threonine-phosphate decarboxylase [Pirellulales bacterium]|nr:threonine-phosphate decarboxylase [Pirellulales bacterium]